MKNTYLWTPTKFVLNDGRWRASNDIRDLAACERHDLTVIELEAYGGGPEVLLTLFSKVFGRVAGLLGLTGSFGRWLLGLQGIRRTSEATRKQFPLGYWLVAEKP